MKEKSKAAMHLRRCKENWRIAATQQSLLNGRTYLEEIADDSVRDRCWTAKWQWLGLGAVQTLTDLRLSKPRTDSVF